MFVYTNGAEMNAVRRRIRLRPDSGKLLSDNGVTRKDLASELNRSDSSVDGYLSGKQPVTVGTASKIAELANANLSDVAYCSDSVGETCYQSIQLTNKLNSFLNQLEVENGFERIRLYEMNYRRLSFDGLIETGGVDDNFRRTSLPIVSDPISLACLTDPGILHLQRKSSHPLMVDATLVRFEDGLPSSAVVKKNLFAHDQPTLRRKDLSQWLDVALVDDRGTVVGKLSIDCLWSEMSGTKREMDPNAAFVWKTACEMAELISRHIRGETISEPISDDVATEAFRYRGLQDHSKSLLVSLKNERHLRGNYDRMRLYLHTAQHSAMFSNYLEITNKKKLNLGQGFLGFVEIGGGVSNFTEFSLNPINDHCTKKILTDHVPHVNGGFMRGKPIVFVSSQELWERRSDSPPCEIYEYAEKYREQDLADDRLEHLDIPLVEGDKIFGKISIDRRWRSDKLIPELTPQQIDTFAEYRERFVALLEVTEASPDAELYSSLTSLGINPQAIL